MSPPTENQRETTIRALALRLLHANPSIGYKQARARAEDQVDSRTHLRGRYR